MSLLLIPKPKPTPAKLRGRKGVRNVIYKHTAQYEQHDLEWWLERLPQWLTDDWDTP